jgi:hypothetical protein
MTDKMPFEDIIEDDEMNTAYNYAKNYGCGLLEDTENQIPLTYSISSTL